MRRKEIIGIDFNKLSTEGMEAMGDLLAEQRQIYDQETHQDNRDMSIKMHEMKKGLSPDELNAYFEYERQNNLLKELQKRINK